jgi:hypothetical protein
MRHQAGEETRSRSARHEQRKLARQDSKHHEKHGRHHPRRHKWRKPARRTDLRQLGTLGVALPTAPASPPAPSSAPVPGLGSVPLTLDQAHRLLWRAGFGPTKGQAESLVGQPLEQVVFSLTRPSGPAVLTGAEPVDEEGKPLDPTGAGARTTAGGSTAWPAPTSSSWSA